jgi:phage terminase large subunit
MIAAPDTLYTDEGIPDAYWDEFINDYQSDPVLFVQEVLGADPFPWQVEVLKAYGAGDRRLSIRSGHRVGKSAVLSWIAIHQLLFRFPQKTIVMAATEKQLFNALMPEIRQWIAIMPQPVQDCLLVQSEYIRHKRQPAASFLSAVAVRTENPEAIAGAHSGGAFGDGYILIICDEASGIPDVVFESLAGSMAGKYATTILAGNPVRRTGFFAQTHGRLRQTEAKEPGHWKTFHVSSENNPNVSADLSADIAARYGVDSNAYRVRVLGEFPISEGDSIVPYDVVLAAGGREVSQQPGAMVWGVDVAAHGDDRTILVKRRVNIVPEPAKVWRKLDPMQISAKILKEWEDTPRADKPIKIYVDVLLWGAAVVARLRELGLPVMGVNVGEAPGMVYGERYRNLRTENWFVMRDWFMRRDCCIPYDEEWFEELATQPFITLDSSGKILATPKKKVRNMLGRSPDKADALMLTFTHGGVFSPGERPQSWNEPLRRKVPTV